MSCDANDGPDIVAKTLAATSAGVDWPELESDIATSKLTDKTSSSVERRCRAAGLFTSCELTMNFFKRWGVMPRPAAMTAFNASGSTTAESENVRENATPTFTVSDAVGKSVGDDDGDNVGAPLGTAEGAADGYELGAAVGAGVGAAVGASTGADVGRPQPAAPAGDVNPAGHSEQAEAPAAAKVPTGQLVQGEKPVEE